MSTPEIPDAAPAADAPAEARETDALTTPEIPDAAPAADAPTEARETDALTPPEIPDAAPTADAAAEARETGAMPPAPVDGSPGGSPADATTVQPPAFGAVQPPAWEAPAMPSARPAAAASVALSGPRIRWAGIVWGLVLAAIAAAGIWLLTDPARQEALASWTLGLTPATSTAIVALTIGVFALVAGVVGIARRAQRGLERRRGAIS